MIIIISVFLIAYAEIESMEGDLSLHAILIL